MKVLRNFYLAAISASVTLAASCGGGTSQPVAGQPLPELSLKVYEESFLGGEDSARFTLSSTDRGNMVESTLHVASADNLRALCIELSYDPDLYTPVAIRRSDRLERVLPDSGLLELEKLSIPGTIHYAHMQPLSSAGLDGEADLLTVSFRRQAMSGERSTSAPPKAAHSVPELKGSILTGQLEWYYRNRGDYDQNGEVNVADITQLGVKLNTVSETPGESFDIASVEWQVDGDENGNINISDITPLGANIGNSVSGGYNIYTSDSESDYPATGGANGAGSTFIGTLGGVPPLSEAFNFTTKSTEHLRFVFELPDPLPGVYYWVRPTDGASEGIPSTMAGPLSVENIPLPVISGIDKQDVVVGETIVVTGTGFGIKDGDDKITLNDLELEVVGWTDTQITAKIPVGAGDGPLVVATLRTSDPSTDQINVIPATPGAPTGNTV
ncbi:MAG: IPT/TIG domain-containing protein [Planctomycetales bacterium]|nr:IPT/TIG domain-containing protein [bacterium]UNM07761.1 MAG: IPT/TIG domain-containing protein [Planctomycetales bacterium]